MSENNPFHFYLKDTHVQVTLTVDHSAEMMDTLESEISSRLFKNILIDCAQIHSSALNNAGRSLAKVARQFRRVDKDVILVGATPELMNVLKQQGTFGLFRIAKSIDELSSNGQSDPQQSEGHSDEHPVVPSAAPSRAGKIDVNIINPFLVSTVNVCSSQAAVKARSGTPFKKSSNDQLAGEFSGVINFESANFQGLVCISFPRSTLKSMICKIIGEERELTLKEISGGAGELLNIIFTQAKAVLNKEGHQVKAALPQLISETSLPSGTVTKIRQRVAVPFETEVGPFCIEIIAA